VRSKSGTTVREEPTFIEAARREQIVRCATETIAELGYGRASLAEIAKQAGISKSVISYYFASKDELIRQIVDDVYATGRAFMTARLESETNATDALRAYLRSNVEFMGAYRTKLLALVEIVASFRTEDGRTAFGPELGAVAVTELEALLRWGQETGEFRAFSTQAMAITIRAAIDALPWRLAAATELELDAYAGELIEIFDLATRRQDTSQRGRKR
jgi:TetR/AcrR family fatty acid metabolism transcriptional regulator